MRASRLVSILLLLQARGRLTAAQLADELEVSVRTIYRDVESLHTAGIPLYGDAGHRGGYQLVGGYRTRLTGLKADEAKALSVSGLLGCPQLSRIVRGWLEIWFPFGRGGVGVQVEACAECRPACPVAAPGGFRAGRARALVPVRCAGQRGPGRCRASLRTLAAAT